jgi:hypothetical protein
LRYAPDDSADPERWVLRLPPDAAPRRVRICLSVGLAVAKARLHLGLARDGRSPVCVRGRLCRSDVPAARSKAYNLKGRGGKEDEAMTIGHNAKAYRLLEAIHDLAGGDPQTAVLSARISARTGIPNTHRAFTTPSMYLKELGLIRTTGTTGTGLVGMFLITPIGIRLVEALRAAG